MANDNYIEPFLSPIVTDEEEEEQYTLTPPDIATPFDNTRDALYSYYTTPNYEEDSTQSILDNISSLGNMALLDDTGESTEFLAREAQEQKLASEYKMSNNQLRNYLAPFPNLDAITEDEDKLAALDEWESDSLAYARTLAKQNDLYGDYVVNKIEIENTVEGIKAAKKREILGEETGWVGDKFYRFTEGGLTFFTKSFGAQETTEMVGDFLPENPAYDDDYSAQLAYSLGQGSGQAIAALAIAAGTYATGGALGVEVGAAAAGATATVANIGMNASLMYQDAYEDIYNKTRDADKATRGALNELPLAAVEGIFDMVWIGKFGGGVKDIAKAMGKEGTKQLTKKEMVDYISKSANNVTRAVFEGGSSEMFSETFTTIASRMNRNYILGTDYYDPFDKKVLAETAAVSFGVGGIMGGAGQIATEAAAIAPDVLRPPSVDLAESTIDELNPDAPAATTKNPSPYTTLYNMFKNSSIAQRARKVAGTTRPGDEGYGIQEILDAPIEPELTPEETARLEEEKITQAIEGKREKVTKLQEAVKAQEALEVSTPEDIKLTQTAVDNTIQDLADETGLSPEEVKAQLGIVEEVVPEEKAAEAREVVEDVDVTDEEKIKQQQEKLRDVDPITFRDALNTDDVELPRGQSRVLKTLAKSGVVDGESIDYIKQHGGMLKHASAQKISQLTGQAKAILAKYTPEQVVQDLANMTGEAYEQVKNLYPNEQGATALTLVHEYIRPQIAKLQEEGKLSELEYLRKQQQQILDTYYKDPMSEAGATLGSGAHLLSQYGSDDYRQYLMRSAEDKIKEHKVAESNEMKKMRGELEQLREEMAGMQAEVAAAGTSVTFDSGIKEKLDREIEQLTKENKNLSEEMKSIKAELSKVRSTIDKKKVKRNPSIKKAEKDFNKAKDELAKATPPKDYVAREKRAEELRKEIKDNTVKKARLQERLKQEIAILSPEDKADLEGRVKELNTLIAQQQEDLVYTFKDPAKESKKTVKQYVNSLSNRRKNIMRMLKDRGCQG